MEFPSIDASAKLANSELLARLKNNRLPTNIDIPTHRIDVSCGDVDEPDDELVPAAPQPAPVPRRQRKRSLATVLAAARKAGADRVVVDGVTIALSPAAAVPESNGNEFDEWMARHANPTKGH
jgi:hypothetical protein